MKANMEAGLQLDRIETPNNDKTKLVAKFTIGTARPFEWKLLSTGNKVFFVNDITRRGVNLILDSSMNIDSTSMEWIKSVVAKSTQTVFSVIQELLFAASAYAVEKSDDYYSVYPNAKDFDRPTGMSVWIKIGHNSAVPLRVAEQSEELSTNLADTNKLDLDIIGESVQREHSGNNDKTNAYSTFVPLFKLVISNGILAITRYTKKQIIVTKSSDGKPEYNETNAKLSHTSAKIDISSISNDYTSDFSLSNQILKAFSDFTVDDSLTAKSSFDANSSLTSPKAVLGWSSSLHSREVAGSVVISHPTSSANIFRDAKVPIGYCIDEFYNTYQSNFHVNITITRDSAHSIKISYGGGRQFGVIAELLINADPKAILDPKDLNSDDNLFIVMRSEPVVVRCNVGHGETKEVSTNIADAMRIIRQMVDIFSCIADVSTLSLYSASQSLRHMRTKFDDYNALVSYQIFLSQLDRDSLLTVKTQVECTILVYSLTATNKIKIHVTVGRSRTSNSYALLCNMINATTNENIEGKQYSGIYNTSAGTASISSQGKAWMDEFKATKKLSAPSNLGAVIALSVLTQMNQHVMANKNGEVIDHDEALQKMIKLARVSTATDLGRMAMAVQQAFFNTFNANGVTVIGTADNPSVFDWNFSIFSQISKPVTGTDGKQNYVPQSISFNINMGYGGTISIMRNSKHEAEAHCGFRGNQHYCIIDIDPQSEHPMLTDEFLKWYLLDGYEYGNPVATGIDRILTRAEYNPNDEQTQADKQAIPERIIAIMDDPLESMDVDALINSDNGEADESDYLNINDINPDDY